MRRGALHSLAFALLLGGLFGAALWLTSTGWQQRLPGSDPRIALLLVERSPALWTAAEPWRAVTSLFVHLSLPHALTSWTAMTWWFLWAAVSSGPPRAWHRAAATLLCAIATNGVLAGVTGASAVGASLWVAVMVGEAFARARSETPGTHLTEAAFGAAVLLASSVSAGVDHVGHVAAVAAGTLLGLASVALERRTSRAGGIVLGHRSVRARAGATAALVICALAWGGVRLLKCSADVGSAGICTEPLLREQPPSSGVE